MPDINMQHFGELQRNQYSIDVEIDASQVASPQQGFPMMLETPNSSNSVLNVVAINELGEQLPTEIEGIANNKNWMHFKDMVHSGWNRKMKVFYGGSVGKSAADNTYGSEAVWDSELVYLMNDNPSGAIYDSTSNSNDGTTYGSMVSGDLIDGDYGKSLVFESASQQHIRVAGVTTPSGNSFTITAKIKIGTLSEGATILMHGLSGDNHIYAFWIPTAGVLNAMLEGTGDQTPISTASTNLEDSVYYTVTLTVDRTNSLFQFYVDGVSDGATNLNFSGTSVGNINPTNDLYIGKWSDAATSDFNGEIGFMRYDIALKSTDYITTTHKNLNNPTASGINPFYKSISKEYNFAESLQSLGMAG